MNFIGSEHPLADLIIFRDLKVKVTWVLPNLHLSEVGMGQGCFPHGPCLRENGEKGLAIPIFIKERESRRPEGANKQGSKDALLSEKKQGWVKAGCTPIFCVATRGRGVTDTHVETMPAPTGKAPVHRRGALCHCRGNVWGGGRE